VAGGARGELEAGEGELTEAVAGLAGSEAKADARQSKEAKTMEKYRKNLIPERHTSLSY
jgi:hypothetical protein